MPKSDAPRPPPDPTFILRGHTADVNCLEFTKNLLVSGDVEGDAIVWDLVSFRPLYRWRPHAASVLALRVVAMSELGCGEEEGDLGIVSHGRDDMIRIWNLTTLLASSDAGRPDPVFSLPVNSLNFCGMSIIAGRGGTDMASGLLATCNLSQSELIDIYDLRSRCYIRNGIGVENASKDTGMCMCLKLFHWGGDVDPNAATPRLLLAAGYESGTVCIWDAMEGGLVGRFKVQDEPVLALDVSPDGGTCVAGGADTKLVQFSTMFDEAGSPLSTREYDIKSRGIGSIKIRGDGRIVGVGCWDSR
ncbi:ASTRA complex subunit [Borealophlyctis nickersoniae]|nr:ASTRA complex subunit [Borealophlyctis nickersoniae]